MGLNVGQLQKLMIAKSTQRINGAYEGFLMFVNGHNSRCEPNHFQKPQRTGEHHWGVHAQPGSAIFLMTSHQVT